MAEKKTVSEPARTAVAKAEDAKAAEQKAPSYDDATKGRVADALVAHLKSVDDAEARQVYLRSFGVAQDDIDVMVAEADKENDK